MNIFERAVIEKVRFDYMGTLMTEDLRDLNMENLDELYRQINAELKDQSGEGLIKDDTNSKIASLLQLKADLVRHIFEMKQKEQEIIKDTRLRQEKKKRIMEIISNKQDQELSDKPVDDLMKMLDEM